jgi:hypothetical protein
LTSPTIIINFNIKKRKQGIDIEFERNSKKVTKSFFNQAHYKETAVNKKHDFNFNF